jgi:hypothetical protein
LLSGRDLLTFPSTISANFFYIIKINKFCGWRQQSDRFSSDQWRPSTSTIGEYITILFVSGQKSVVSASRRNQESSTEINRQATGPSFQEEKAIYSYQHKLLPHRDATCVKALA